MALQIWRELDISKFRDFQKRVWRAHYNIIISKYLEMLLWPDTIEVFGEPLRMLLKWLLEISRILGGIILFYLYLLFECVTFLIFIYVWGKWLKLTKSNNMKHILFVLTIENYIYILFLFFGQNKILLIIEI